jgi:hypothetical protein
MPLASTIPARLWLAFVLLLSGSIGTADDRVPKPASAASPVETSVPRAERLKWWREGRFGMFIHWGPVSLKGTEISWSRGAERRGIAGKGEIPVEVYDNLYKEFNPTKFDAKGWRLR